MSLTPFRSDFIGPIKPVPTKNSKLKSLTASASILGYGTVKWTIFDLFGNTHTIETTAYFVPEADVRLFSPQSKFQEQEAGSLHLDHKRTVYTSAQGDQFEFPYNCCNNLPLMLLDQSHRSASTAGLISSNASILADNPRVLTNVAEERNQNLTNAERELLLWHHNLGHVNLQWIKSLTKPSQQLSNGPIIMTKHPSVGNCNTSGVKCAACEMSKMKKRPTGARHVQAPHDMKLKKDKLIPGQTLFLDHYKSSVPGRLPTTKGKEATHLKFTGGLLGVDELLVLSFCRIRFL